MNIIENMWMEDVGDIATKAHDIIEQELKTRFNKELSVEESDIIYNAIWKPLEDLSNGNYRREL